MSESPSHRTRSSNRSQARARAEPWEVERMHREFPVKSREELERTLEDCKGQTDDAKEKNKLTRCVQRKLGK